MDLAISGRTAAVAAASRGLGLAVAQALAAEGARVAICGRNREALEAAAAPIGAVPVVADVSGPDGANAFVAEAHEALGGLDILVTNAGGPPPGDFAGTDLDAYLDAFELNCRSAIAMCRAAVPEMREKRWGRVIAITSIGVRQPIANLIASSTARAGLTAFLKVLAREVAADNVTVNSLLPGFHRTERLAELYDGSALDRLAGAVPARRIGDPADFGRVAAFLCSPAAGYITGAAIPVDGGVDASLL